jgi:hypothetical protein
MTGVDIFVDKSRELIDLEREEEIQQSTYVEHVNRKRANSPTRISSSEALKGQTIKRLVERGLCLSRLRFQHVYTGLYGRTIAVFDGESLSRVQTFGPGRCRTCHSNEQYHSLFY